MLDIAKVIDKWFSLQRIIKEGITLNGMIEKEKTKNSNSLISYYKEYYTHKLKTREIQERTLKIDNNLTDYASFELCIEQETVLNEAYLPVMKLMMYLRNNIQSIVKVVTLMEKNIGDNRINSIVDLFCHQFYENILIPNPEHEELLILCYLLLEREINNMDTASVTSFIDESSTFLGKFLKSYSKKQELKTYFAMTLGTIICNIENNDKMILDLNPVKIAKRMDDVELSSEGIHAAFERKGNILKYPTHRNRTISIKEPINKTDFRKTYTTMDSYLKVPEAASMKEFVEPLTMKNLTQRINNEKDENLKEFYKRQYERLRNSKDIYTCAKFLESIQHLQQSNMILGKYIQGYKSIKNLICNIIKSLRSNVNTIPYTLRCICKFISILIQRKFPQIRTYERNGFIGEFIFGKCILPILVNSDINAVINSSILSSNIRECLKITAKVIIKISRGLFFDSCDMNLTIFNHFIIDLIPEMNQFYNDLIQVELPNVVNQLLNGIIESNAINKYDYFSENSEELLNIKCVCYSIEDVLLLLQYIKPEINGLFKPDASPYNGNKTNEENFIKTIKRLGSQEEYLIAQTKESTTMRFFIMNEIEENPKKMELITIPKERLTFSINQETMHNQNTDLILSKVKSCVIRILQGLNLINNRVYPYLNQANTNQDFFISINQTLQADDYSAIYTNNSNRNSESPSIPLNWYSLYMVSNLQNLKENYQKDDYCLLYEELMQDQHKLIEMLKTKSHLIITKYGMNVTCAENILQNINVDKLRNEKIEKIIKTKKFLKDTKINVCVYSINEQPTEKIKESIKNAKVNRSINWKKKSTIYSEVGDNQQYLGPQLAIVVETIDKCVHSELFEYYNNQDVENDLSLKHYHINTIKEFIRVFHKFREVNEDVRTPISLNMTKSNYIAKSIVKYLQIIKDKINDEQLQQEKNKQERLNQEQIKRFEQMTKEQKKEEMNRIAQQQQNLSKRNDSKIGNDAIKVKDDTIEIVSRINEYIQKMIYSKIFPEFSSDEDFHFYKVTLLLSWVTPMHLEIKKIYLNEKLWELAIQSINKIDDGKTPMEKVSHMSNALHIINRSIQFCSGKNEEPGADDYTPILQYIIIKARPKRMLSNIFYINSMYDPEMNDNHTLNYYNQQIYAATEFLTFATHDAYKITKEEYDKNIAEKAVENNINLELFNNYTKILLMRKNE